MNRMFLRIEDIPGEARDERHRNWIEVSAVNWAVASGPFSHDRVSSPARFHDFTVAKAVDKSSPLLALACASGRMLKSVLIEFVYGNDRRALVFYKVRVSDVLVRTIKGRAISAGSGRTGTATFHEEVAFSFDEIVWFYQPGATDTWPVSAGYSIKEGRALNGGNSG